MGLVLCHIVFFSGTRQLFLLQTDWWRDWWAKKCDARFLALKFAIPAKAMFACSLRFGVS